MKKLRKIVPIGKFWLRKYLLLPIKILKVSLTDTMRHDGVEHAGYLAFLSILSLFPSLIFFISIIGLIGASKAGEQIIDIIYQSLPKEILSALTPRINEIVSGPEQSLLTIAILGVIWTASSSVEGCRTILNRAYRITLPPPYIWRRMVSIFEFFIIIFAVVSGVVIFVVVPNLLQILEENFGIRLDIDYDFFYIRQIAIFFLLSCATSLLYYALPNAKQKFTQTVPGSILTVILWGFLHRALLFYLSNFHQVSFVYGSLAGVIATLMFFYLMSLAFIVGAEFNYNFHRIYQILLKNHKQ